MQEMVRGGLTRISPLLLYPVNSRVSGITYCVAVVVGVVMVLFGVVVYLCRILGRTGVGETRPWP